MDKIWLIIKREYTSRVLKKSFLLITILTPLSIVLIGVIAGLLASKSSKTYNVALYDEAKVVKLEDIKDSEFKFSLIDASRYSSLKDNYGSQNFDILMKLPKLDSLAQAELNASYFANEKLSIATISGLERTLDKQVEAYKLSQSPVDKKIFDDLKVDISLENALSQSTASSEDANVKGDTSSKMSSAIATGLSYLMGFMMYMVIFVFGGMVMRSVMEEKINRVVEVMVSTVKPFQLLLGKIIGVGLVGLTQLLIWMILIPAAMFITSSVMGIDASAAAAPSIMSNPEITQAVESNMSEMSAKIGEFLKALSQLNWWLIIPAFIIFFFGGYFIYSALFSAVGASIGDDISEGQQLMLPIITPVIIAFIMLNNVIADPNGSIAIFGSMFPLFSPIIMPARLPFDPPMWQVILSIIFLIAGVLFITWVAARIYRVGIFMYGKKAGFKDLGKWIFLKD
jgi:ABC-2 type transport system permease protein